MGKISNFITALRIWAIFIAKAMSPITAFLITPFSLLWRYGVIRVTPLPNNAVFPFFTLSPWWIKVFQRNERERESSPQRGGARATVQTRERGRGQEGWAPLYNLRERGRRQLFIIFNGVFISFNAVFINFKAVFIIFNGDYVADFWALTFYNFINNHLAVMR